MTTVWGRLRAIPGWMFALVAGVVLLLLPQAGLDFSTMRQLQLSLILALVVSGLNLSLGYAGELALGQVAMYAAGAYTAGLLAQHGHTDLLLQLVAAGVVALVVGVLTGIPGLRLGSWSLAMTSFFLILLVPDVLAIFEKETGGRNGLSVVGPTTLFGTVLTPDDYYIAMAVVTIVWFGVFRNIVVSRRGLALRVLKQSPILASSIGISVVRMKLFAYAVGAIPAGLAGALLANLDLYISPEAFSFTVATTVLAASILGGSASVYGAAIGAAVLQFGLNQTSAFQQYSLIVTGAFLIAGGVLLTGGIAGLVRHALTRVDARLIPQIVDEAVDLDDLAPLEIKGATLRVENLSKAFGGNQALRGAELVAEPGRVTALIGPNGSGKTTMLNMVCGFYRTDDGQILLDGKRIHGLTPDRVARAGVARTFQTPNIPEGITVREAVASGRYATQRVSILGTVLRLPSHWRAVRTDDSETERALRLVGLWDERAVEAVALPLGMRRLLEVARALVMRPGVLLLDEVASGLDEDELDRLGDVIRTVRDAGGTVVLVEHNFQLVLSLADEIFALAQGELMARGTPDEISSNKRVMSEYLGIKPDAAEDLSIADLLTATDPNGDVR